MLWDFLRIFVGIKTKQKDKMKVGIIGTGRIAEKAAITLNGLDNCEAYAVGSRQQETADAFAAKWNIPKAYGSYTELIADKDIDLVYIGTPHSHHYDVTRQAIMAGKPCLVEKAFMANATQAQDIIRLAHEKQVFLAEAIWTRYQPAVGIVRKLMADGRIGQPRMVTATLDGHCVKSDTGMDLTNAITIILKDGILANVQSSAQCVGDNIGVIAGTQGNIIIDNINNPQTITLNGPNRTFVETIHVPQQITGYEYQFLACRQALIDKLTEPREMPHAETLYVMQLMYELRRKWGVRYPMDN